jgi:hypothetical protein
MIVCFRFPTNASKKIEYIRFLNKIHCRTKTFSFRSQNFWSKSIRFFQFQNFFKTLKSSVLVLEIGELNQNVSVLFQSFYISSALVLKNSGTHQNVLVLIQMF